MKQKPKLNSSHIYYVKNGNIESHNSNKIWSKLEAILKQEKQSYTCFETEYAVHAKELTKSILEKATEETVIIAVGGDGTFNEVLNGSIGYEQAIIGSIPAGSGNDYVRGIQKTKSIEDALHLIQNKEDCAVIDVCEVTTQAGKRYFVNSLGIGFDASICEQANNSKWKKRFQRWKIGKFIYIYYFVKQLFVFKPFHLKIETDGQVREYERVWFAVASNQPYFGGGIKVSPNSSADDGKLRVFVVHSLTSYLFLFVFVTVFWGGHMKLHRWVDHFECRKMKAFADKETSIQTDGESYHGKEVNVKLIPKKVKVFVNS